MSDSSMAIQRYVAAGNLRQIDSPETDLIIDEQRRTQLQRRLAGLREQWVGLPSPQTTNPSDFRAAVQVREEKAYQRERDERFNGKDIPRPTFQNTTINNAAQQVYKAHDFVTGLPSPGGLGAILLAIIILFLVLIPATGKGETRLLLLWDVLLGRKAISDPSQVAPAENVEGRQPLPGEHPKPTTSNPDPARTTGQVTLTTSSDTGPSDPFDIFLGVS